MKDTTTNKALFHTPILLITFNRPNHTRQVWDAIKQQRPSQVYVFQDGSRATKDMDIEKGKAVRAIFEEPLDWDCEIKTYYSDKNLGCGLGPASAITWFFEQVEEGIILEDDCLPHPDFFVFCEELLNKYQNNKQIMAIGTTTYHDNYPCDDSYCFSKYFTGGAWATWKYSWEGFSLHLNELDIKQFKKNLKNQFYTQVERKWWFEKVLFIQKDQIDKAYWDYQMQIHILNNKGLVIRPRNNMVSNIGFDIEGTHTKSNADNRGYRKTDTNLPITHPKSVYINEEYDYLFMAKEHKKPLHQRIARFIYKTMENNDGIWKRALLKYKQMKRAWRKK